MNILKIVIRSFSESLQIPRFLPFFLLYLVPLLTGALFMVPILKVLPSLLTNQFSQYVIGVVGINAITVLIIFTITAFTSLWFIGALTHNIQIGKNFNSSLKYSSSIYWHLLAFSLLSVVFTILSSFTDIGIIIKLIFDILFFVSIPAIVKQKNFLKGTELSLNLVKKNFLQTILMLVLVTVINLILLAALFFFITILFVPSLEKIFVVNPDLNTFETFSAPQYVQLVGYILNNYHYVFIAAIISAFFSSVVTVFSFTAKTYYFLHLSKKKL